ncbi:MAG: dockerin type I domain-containing protein, partial [Candidatus Zixiibacteriota bacterium]
DNLLSNTIGDATYSETGRVDSVYIDQPIPGPYDIEIIGVDPDPPPGSVYGVGILIDGSNVCAVAEAISVVSYGASDSYNYEVEEDWHYLNADADGNQKLNILDITFLISYLYKGGPAPYPLNSGDANCNLVINILDITYLIAYLYKDGPPPCFLYD